jgi:hypothetical protein
MSTDENFDASIRIVSEVLSEILKSKLGRETGPYTLLATRIVAALDEVHLLAEDDPHAPSDLEARLKALEDIVQWQVAKHVFTRKEVSHNYSAGQIRTSCTCGWSHERSIYPGHVRQDRVSIEQSIAGDEMSHLESEGVR